MPIKWIQLVVVSSFFVFGSALTHDQASGGATETQSAAVYNRPSRLTWVVKDVASSVRGWSKFGLRDVTDHGQTNLAIEYRGVRRPARLHRISGWLGGLKVDWIQPLRGDNAYSDFLKRRGDGVFSVMFQVLSRNEYQAEIDRLRGLGVQVLQKGGLADIPAGNMDYVYFDTEQKGKYALGLMLDPASTPVPAGSIKINHLGFVIRDLNAVTSYWTKLGFDKPDFLRPLLENVSYRKRPAQYDQELGIQRFGFLFFEWSLVPQGENLYREFLSRHGEGVQHIGSPVSNLDQGMAALKFPVAQSGAWRLAGQSGLGRYAYMDPVAGVSFELVQDMR